MSRKNIRRHRRIPYIGPIRICWESAAGETCHALGKCVDVSESGLCLETFAPIPEHAMVILKAEGIQASGSAQVRHVSRRGMRYRVGLELSNGLRERVLAEIGVAHAVPEPAGVV